MISEDISAIFDGFAAISVGFAAVFDEFAAIFDNFLTIFNDFGAIFNVFTAIFNDSAYTTIIQLLYKMYKDNTMILLLFSTILHQLCNAYTLTKH